MVKEKPKEIKIDNEIIMKARARYCSLTKEKLSNPIAICKLGFLYNYKSVLNFLVEKRIPKKFSHIKNFRKDIKIVNSDLVKKESNFPIVCPISQIEYNGLSAALSFNPTFCFKRNYWNLELTKIQFLSSGIGIKMN